MRIRLFSQLESSPGDQLFTREATSRGHEVTPVRPLSLHGELTGEVPQDAPDLIFARTGSAAPSVALDLLRMWELQGIPCINPSSALQLARDKARCYLELHHRSVPIPRTVLLGREAPLEEALRLVPGPPWILKLPVGTKGRAVILVESAASLRSVVSTLQDLSGRLLLQEFVAESRGTDLRVLVLGGRAVAAARRTAGGDEFRSNVDLGGLARPCELTEECRQVAEAAARAVGLEVAGVDLLESSRGPLVLEVNGSPGLQGDPLRFPPALLDYLESAVFRAL